MHPFVMSERLKQRRIVLTGVSRGVGLETARVFLQEGADVIGIARDADRLEQASRQLSELAPGRFQPLCVDLGSPGFEGAVVDAVTARWGALDVLCNNAGIMVCHEPGILGEPPEAVEQTLQINLMAPLALARALLPLLERGIEPRIVNVSSGAGTLEGIWEPGIASYRLSKWALNGLTMLQAAELKGRVAVNALDPGWVKTDLGGPRAPGHPSESAQGALAMLLLDPTVTGKFFKDGNPIPY
jgi:NAD(P)-dependent dehydrogenase (short-subunit alcohol dehydrogenase family)